MEKGRFARSFFVHMGGFPHLLWDFSHTYLVIYPTRQKDFS